MQMRRMDVRQLHNLRHPSNERQQMSIEHFNEPLPPSNSVMAWAEGAKAAASVAVSLAKTSFVPANFRGKPEEVTAAIMLGSEVGLSPMQSLQNIFVISGKPGMYARTMVALVMAAGHEIVTVKKTDGAVSVKGRRAGTQEWTEETWTTERARKAGYTSNKKYETDPQSMLYARAAADICRQIAPDALAGLAYTVEELEAENAPKERVQRVARNSAPEPLAPALEPAQSQPNEIQDAVLVDEIPLPPEPPSDAPVEFPEVAGISEAQTKMMGALMRQVGITDKDMALQYCASVIGHDIETRNELTKTEASLVIDALQKDKGELNA
jgi:predicted ATPase